MKIDSFSGDYEFLSNFYKHPITWNNKLYASGEHLFQARKAITEEDHDLIRNTPSPNSAKKLGHSVKIIPNVWDATRIQVMQETLEAKFQDAVLRQKLLDTGNAELIEGNWWGDVYWGVCKGKGQNWLGKLLMELRVKLLAEKSVPIA